MKTCDEMVNSLFQRREEYLAQQKIKRRNTVISAALYCCAFAAVAGIGVWVKGEVSRKPVSVDPSATNPGSTAGSSDAANMTTPLSEGELSEPLPYTAPELFGSFKDFEEHEKKAKTNAVSFYYVPASVPSGFELTEIAKRDNIYVMVTYSIPDNALSANDAQEYAGLNSYDASRLQTLICERWLYPDGQSSLESFIANDYKPMEYEGRTYYRWDEHAENDPEKRVIGYELAFLDDGNLIFMHLPAIDTFENMMKYAKVEKAEIEGEPDNERNGKQVHIIWDSKPGNYGDIIDDMDGETEWNGKLISGRLWSALDKGGEDCLYAVEARYFPVDEQFVYNGKTLAQYKAEHSEKTRKLETGFIIKRLLEAADSLEIENGDKISKDIYDKLVSYIEERISKPDIEEEISEYIVDGVFLKDKAVQYTTKATEEWKAAVQAQNQAEKAFRAHFYKGVGKQLEAQGIENEFIYEDTAPEDFLNSGFTSDYLLLFISKEDFANLNLGNMSDWIFCHAYNNTERPIIWAEEPKIEGDTVSSLDHFVKWNGKDIHNRLLTALEENKNDDNCLFAVNVRYSPIDYQYVYNGKTLAQYEEETQGKRLDQLNNLLKEGEALKYGEALYQSGTPDGEKWSKELYDSTVAKYGEEFLSQYIVDGVFLKDKVLRDIPEAEKEMEAAQAVFEQACIAYRFHVYEETLEQLEAQGIKYELSKDPVDLILFISKEDFADLTLENMSNWIFFHAPKSEKYDPDTAINE